MCRISLLFPAIAGEVVEALCKMCWAWSAEAWKWHLTDVNRIALSSVNENEPFNF